MGLSTQQRVSLTNGLNYQWVLTLESLEPPGQAQLFDCEKVKEEDGWDSHRYKPRF